MTHTRLLARRRARRRRLRGRRRGARVRARHAAHDQPQPAAPTTRRPRDRRCASASRSKCRSAASALRRRREPRGHRHARSTRTAPATRCAVSIPKLDDGTYVVTWRVISADSHPVEGAFTFQVGRDGNGDEERRRPRRRAAVEPERQHRPSACVYAIDRAVLFGALALLIGGVVFLVAVFPRGRVDRAGAELVWAGWISVAVTTVLGIALEGVYAAGVAADEGLRPERVQRRARHAVRAGRAAAAGAARARVPVDPHAVAPDGDGPREPLRAVVAGRRRRWSASGSRSRRGSPGTRRPASDRLAIPADPVHVGGDGVLARGPRGALRRGAPATRRRRDARGAAAVLRARRSVRSSRSWSPAASRPGARSAASTRSRTPTTAGS